MAKAAACSREQGDAQHVAALVIVDVEILLVVDLPAGFFEHDDDAVDLLVVGDADGPDHPLGILASVKGQVLGKVAGPAQLLDDPSQVAGQHRHLLLLNFDRGLGDALAHVEEKEAAPHLADDADRAVVGGVVVDLVTHDGANSLRDPVELTHSTAGPPLVKSRADTEQGEITSRCMRSRGTPAAAATMALIGSACDTATIVSPGWLATRVQYRIHRSYRHVGERLAARESKPTRPALDGGPFLGLVQPAQRLLGPVTHVRLDQTGSRAHP